MKRIILILIAVIGIGAIAYVSLDDDASQQAQPSIWETGSGEELPASYDLSTGETYEDLTRKLSFRYPKGFSVTKFPDGVGGEVIIVQLAEKAQGFQIAISPFDGIDSTLSVDMIRQEIPDLEIRDAQDLLLGESGKGVAFLSDNESFGGDSREVWFVYRGELYQISTYARLDPLLQSVLATWKFK